MSTTAFAQVIEAVRAALAASPALAGGRVFVNRLRPLAASDATAIVVRLDGTRGRESVLGARDWTTLIAVECYGRTVGTTTAEASADALVAAAWQRLMALQAPALGLMEIGVEAEIDWQRDSDASAEVCAVIRLTATHRTPYESLTPWPD